ncbi:MAG: hypothetical protein ACYC3I_06520 [Gemmataceae bacterium]
MMDDVSAVFPHVAIVQATTPSPEVPVGESEMAAPTAEQASAADRIFTDTHPAATLLGVLTSAMLLRDVAIDTFDTSGEEEEEENPRLDTGMDPVV